MSERERERERERESGLFASIIMGTVISSYCCSPDQIRKRQIMKLLGRFHFEQLLNSSYSVITAASYSRLALLVIHKINQAIVNAGDDDNRTNVNHYADSKTNEAILITLFFVFSYISGTAMVRFFSKLKHDEVEIFGVSLDFMIHISDEICAFSLKDVLVYTLFAFVYSYSDKLCYLYMSLVTALVFLLGLVAIKVLSCLCDMIGMESDSSAAIVHFNGNSFGFAAAIAMATILLSALNFQLESESTNYSDDDGSPALDDGHGKEYTNVSYLLIVWMVSLFLCGLLSDFFQLDTKESEKNSSNYKRIFMENSHALTGSLLSESDINSSLSADRITMDALGEDSSGIDAINVVQEEGYQKMYSTFLGTFTAYFFFILLSATAADNSSSDAGRALNIFFALIGLASTIHICVRLMNITAYKRYFDVKLMASSDENSCLSSARKLWRGIQTKNIDFKLQMYRIVVAFMIEETLVRVYGQLTTESTPNIILAAAATFVMLVGFSLLEYYSEQKEKEERKKKMGVVTDHYDDDRSSSIIL